MKSTKNIFIESALFNAVSIGKTAKRHGLNTDASFRYERGVDCNMVIPALIKASQLILELGGGEISSEIFDFYPEKQNDYTFEINFDNVRKIGGFNIDNHEIIEILNLIHRIRFMEDTMMVNIKYLERTLPLTQIYQII